MKKLLIALAGRLERDQIEPGTLTLLTWLVLALCVLLALVLALLN